MQHGVPRHEKVIWSGAEEGSEHESDDHPITRAPSMWRRPNFLRDRLRWDTVCNESVPMSGLVGKKDGNNFIKYFQMSSLRVLDNTKFYRSLANDDDGDDVMMCGRQSNCELRVHQHMLHAYVPIRGAIPYLLLLLSTRWRTLSTVSHAFFCSSTVLKIFGKFPKVLQFSAATTTRPGDKIVLFSEAE